MPRIRRHYTRRTTEREFGRKMAEYVIGSIRTKVTDPEARAEAVRFVTRKFDPAMPAKVEVYAAQLEIAGLSAADALEEAIAKALDEEAYKHASGLGTVADDINAALGPQTWWAPPAAAPATSNWMDAAGSLLSSLTQSAGQIFGQVSQYTAARDERRAAAAQAGREFSAAQLQWESQQRSAERQAQEAQRAAELEAARQASGGYGGGAYGIGGGLSGTTILLGALGLAVVGGGVYFLTKDK